MATVTSKRNGDGRENALTTLMLKAAFVKEVNFEFLGKYRCFGANEILPIFSYIGNLFQRRLGLNGSRKQ